MISKKKLSKSFFAFKFAITKMRVAICLAWNRNRMGGTVSTIPKYIYKELKRYVSLSKHKKTQTRFWSITATDT